MQAKPRSHNRKDVDRLSKEDLHEYIRELDKQYHELGVTSVSDDEYDTIKDLYEEKFGPSGEVGHPVVSSSSSTVKLPYFMGSMNKKKDADSITKWSAKYQGPYVVSDKLDGVSALFTAGKLFTRGNGHVGRDVSHLIQHLRLPKLKDNDVCVRGELVISKLNFNRLVDDDVLSHRAIPRNTVAGCVNATEPDVNVAKSIDFVAFELIQPRVVHDKQHDALKALKFKHVVNRIQLGDISHPELSDILNERKKFSKYDIDGIVIHDCSKIHDIPIDSNPPSAFAFKMLSNQTKATVKQVQWNISKDSLAKPTVILDPVVLDGIRISKATGFNAKFIQDNKIGVGSVVNITRSGDVIPHILNVVSSTSPHMPNFEYAWTPSKVDIIVTDESDEIQRRIRLKSFQNTISKLDIDGLKDATITVLFDAGIDDLKSLFELSESSITEMSLPGFKKAKINNLLNSIRRTKENLDCVKLMSASNCFGKGFSTTRLSSVLEKVENMFDGSMTAEDISQLEGFGKLTASQFVDNIPKFKRFLEDNDLMSYCLEKRSKKVPTHKHNAAGSKLGDMSFCFSGGLIPEAIHIIDKFGGSVVKNMSSCTHLIVSDKTRKTTKHNLAVKKKLPILDLDDLKAMVEN